MAAALKRRCGCSSAAQLMLRKPATAGPWPAVT